MALPFLVLNFYAHFVTPGHYFRRSAKFQEEYTLVFSEEGLLFRSKDMKSNLEWGFYTKVWETPEFYFLCYDRDMFTLIPKRVFTSKGQQSAFRDLLSHTIKASFETQELPGREGSEDYVPPQNPPDWR